MRVGILPHKINKEYEYSSGCRAYALIRNIEYCELFNKKEDYDIVLFQKRFDHKSMKLLQSKGSKCIVDSCDSHLLYVPNHYRSGIRTADFITVSTENAERC